MHGAIEQLSIANTVAPHSSPCAFIVEQGELIGLLTLGDLVQAIALGQFHYSVGEISFISETLCNSQLGDSVAILRRFFQTNVLQMPIVDCDRRPLGLITPYRLWSYAPNIASATDVLVDEILEPAYPRVWEEQSLLSVAHTLTHTELDLVVVHRRDRTATPDAQPVGMITVFDIFNACLAQVNFAETAASSIMQKVVPPLQLGDSMEQAKHCVETYGEKSLLVGRPDGSLAGVIGQRAVLERLEIADSNRNVLSSQLEHDGPQRRSRPQPSGGPGISFLPAAHLPAPWQVAVDNILDELRNACLLSFEVSCTRAMGTARQFLACSQLILWEQGATAETETIAAESDKMPSPLAAAALGYRLWHTTPDLWDSYQPVAVSTAGSAFDQQRLRSLHADIRATLTVPVRVRGRLWGLLIASHWHQQRRWDSDDAALLETMGTQIASILQNRQRQPFSTPKVVALPPIVTPSLPPHSSQVVVDTIPDYLFRVDREGTYLSVFNHRSGLTLFAADLDPVGLKMSEVLPPKIAARQMHYLKKALATDSPQVYEQYISSDRCDRYEEVRIMPCGDGEALFIIRDITERRRTEQQLQNLISATAVTGKDFFVALVWHLATALDTEYALVTRCENHHLSTLACYGKGQIQPNYTYSFAQTPCEQVLLKGEYYCETSAQQLFPNDSELELMDIESFLGVAMYDSEGEMIGHLCVMHTQPVANLERATMLLRAFAARAAAELERQQTTEALQQLNQDLESIVAQRTTALHRQTQLLKTVLDTFPFGIYWKNRQSKYLGGNHRFLDDAGLTSIQELVGKTDRDLPNLQDQAAELIEAEQRIMDTATPELRQTISKPLTNGSHIWIEISRLPLYNLEGSVIGLVGTYEDVTERKRTEELIRRTTAQLQASNQELEVFASSVSHDLQAPLRAIAGFTAALQESCPSLQAEPDAQDYLQRIANSAHQMEQLIDNLLRLSQVSRAEMSYTTLNLSEIANHLQQQLQMMAPERKVSCSIEPDVVAHGDPTLLRVILSNLFQNAWKFTSRQSMASVKFGTFSHGDQLIYYVQDDGIGFDMAHTDRIFDAFQRLHSADEFSGTGLGLATVKRAVQRHGGTIWAESAVGQGATFYFTLPKYDVLVHDQ